MLKINIPKYKKTYFSIFLFLVGIFLLFFSNAANTYMETFLSECTFFYV